MVSGENELGAHWALLLIVAGIAAMGVGGYMLYDERQAVENAVEVDAVVLDSHVDEYRDSGEGTEYYPRIEYEYTYEGETYTSDNVFASPDTTSVSQGTATSMVEEDYPEGATVTAHVDSENPSEAYLEVMHKDTLGMILLIPFGFVILLFGLEQFLKWLVGVSLFGTVRGLAG